MTEDEWSSDPHVEFMLEFLRGRASHRKLRLFAVACCRSVWSLLKDGGCRQAIEVAERFADDPSVRAELDAALRTVDSFFDKQGRQHFANQAAYAVGSEPPNVAWVVEAIDELPPDKAARQKEYHGHAALLRHIIGNPFRPYPAPSSWPSTVVQLAESLYQGQDCRLPLSDALEESGHQELAEHFRREEWHPKGCFALDLVLGKE